MVSRGRKVSAGGKPSLREEEKQATRKRRKNGERDMVGEQARTIALQSCSDIERGFKT